MAAARICDMSTLAERVQALPAELFAEIYDLTFTLDKKLEITVDEEFKHPSLLQVSKATRNQLNTKFYNGTTFVIPEASEKHALKWFQALDNELRLLMSA